MSDPADRYCSDCAWPYECAAAGSCHRRDMGEVRGEDLTPRACLTISNVTSAEEATRRAAYWRPERGVPGGPVMVTLSAPGASDGVMQKMAGLGSEEPYWIFFPQPGRQA